MTVQVETARVSYTGAGTTGPFSIPFYFLQNADIKAVKVTIADGTETALALTTDYTLSGAGDEAGGSLTLVSSLSSSFKLVIYRDPELLQEVDYPRNDPFPAKTHEQVADRLTMIAQRVKDLLSRMLRLTDGDTTGLDLELPAATAADRASAVIGFDANGTALQLYDPSSAVTAASNVNFTPSGTGAVAETVAEALQRLPMEDQYSSTANYNTALDALASDPPLDDKLVAVKYAGGSMINLHKWINGNRVVAGSPSEAVFSTLADAVAEAITLSKSCEFTGEWTVTASLALPSGFELSGHGRTRSIIKLGDGANTTVLKNSDQVGGNSNIILRNFKINGNKANQSGGTAYGIWLKEFSDILLEGVEVADTRHIGFFLPKGARFLVKGCKATGVETATHTGFYLGENPAGTYAEDGQLIGCYAASNGQDGILVELGKGVSVIGCVSKNNTQSGIKVGDGERVIVSGCYTEGNENGFRGQAIDRCSYVGNIAYRNNGNGFNLGIASGVVKDILVANNQAIENGQNPASTAYGFNVDYSGGTVDGLFVHNNVAVDRQGSPTQTRGFSFGNVTGTIENFVLTNNFAKGNSSSDYFLGTAVTAPVYRQGNIGFQGAASDFALDPMSKTHIQFWVDNIAASTGTTLLSDGFGGRGFIVPRKGWLRSLTIKSNADITAGTLTVIPRVNGSNSSPNGTLTSANGPNYRQVTQTFPGVAVAAGDRITCIYSTDAGLLPTGTADIDVVLELVS